MKKKKNWIESEEKGIDYGCSANVKKFFNNYNEKNHVWPYCHIKVEFDEK